jgi:Tol biopolymer transport system component
VKARLRVTLLAISAATVSLLSAAPAGATFPGTNGRIAYYNFAELPRQIYSVDADGTDLLQLTTGTRSKVDPAWSADGSMIALGSSSRRQSRGRLEVMNADGSARSIVVAYEQNRGVADPAWSPDGSQIAFCRQAPRGVSIWVVDVDGTNLTRLSGPDDDDCSPDWSPDGTRIVFTSFTDDAGLWLMDADGTDRAELVNGFADAPSWSPDGTKIAFARTPLRSNRSDIFVVNADASGRTRLTFTERRWEFTPAWSPDGSSIAYCKNTGPEGFAFCEIWTMDPDGSNATRITATPDIDEFGFSWQAT